jgi:extracellular factor (EF) 3-hydroxypalmitic acid methyl ester biosynthesis protein
MTWGLKLTQIKSHLNPVNVHRALLQNISPAKPGGGRRARHSGSQLANRQARGAAAILKWCNLESQSHIDPVVSFRSTQGEAVRGTIVNLQRKSLVMEVYNPAVVVQVSEVLSELTVRLGSRSAYNGKAVVSNLVNTGLTAVLSLTLVDEWRELQMQAQAPSAVGLQANHYVREWDERFRIDRDYQVVVNEMRAFLADVSRWIDQVDLSDALPREADGRLRADFFYELAAPFMARTRDYLERLELAAAAIDPDSAPAHRAFAQAALHPLILRAPFVHRSYTKPLGYAGDFQMVNQILGDPRQGPNTYFQIVNTAFLQTPVAAAHRNRIDILVAFLLRLEQRAAVLGRPLRVLNVGCGPAVEIERFIEQAGQPQLLEFELVDFSADTLAWTRAALEAAGSARGGGPEIRTTEDSVHKLLKRRGTFEREFDAVYCAGLFDYLSDKVCTRLMEHFAARLRSGGTMLVTNVHSDNPGKHGMEHLLDWHLIYRDQAGLEALLPAQAGARRLYVDATGVNVFAESTLG